MCAFDIAFGEAGTNMFSLCVFCIRKRHQTAPVRPARAPKKPALRRAEARERLDTVTDVSNLTSTSSLTGDETTEHKVSVETRSVLEREW